MPTKKMKQRRNETFRKLNFFYAYVSDKQAWKMKLRYVLIVFALNLQLKLLRAQDNLLQFLVQQTNFLVFNSTYIIDDTVKFLPSYDFIIIGSGSGG